MDEGGLIGDGVVGKAQPTAHTPRSLPERKVAKKSKDRKGTNDYLAGFFLGEVESAGLAAADLESVFDSDLEEELSLEPESDEDSVLGLSASAAFL